MNCNGVTEEYTRIALGVNSLGGNRIAQLLLNPDDTVAMAKQQLWEIVPVHPCQQLLIRDQLPLQDDCKFKELLLESRSQQDCLEVTVVTVDHAWSQSDCGASVALSTDAQSASALCDARHSPYNSHRAIGTTKFSDGPFVVALRLQGKPGSTLTKLTRVGICSPNGETWSYDSSGDFQHKCGKATSCGPAYGFGDVVVVNYRDGEVSFSLNGVDLGTRFKGVQLPLRAFADCTCTVAEWSFSTPM